MTASPKPIVCDGETDYLYHSTTNDRVTTFCGQKIGMRHPKISPYVLTEISYDPGWCPDCACETKSRLMGRYFRYGGQR